MKLLTSLSAVALATVAFAAPASADTFILNVGVDGVLSVGEQGDPSNTILNFALPTDAVVTGIGWDLTLTAFDPSWLDELTVAFLDSPFDIQLILSPAGGDIFPGTGAYSSGGIVDLASIDPSFPFAVTDGFLSLEFFEGFDDPEVSPDGQWAGTLTFQYEAAPTGDVPEPATWAMMIGGMGLAGGALRSRRKVAFAA